MLSSFLLYVPQLQTMSASSQFCSSRIYAKPHLQYSETDLVPSQSTFMNSACGLHYTVVRVGSGSGSGMALKHEVGSGSGIKRCRRCRCRHCSQDNCTGRNQATMQQGHDISGGSSQKLIFRKVNTIEPTILQSKFFSTLSNII